MVPGSTTPLVSLDAMMFRVASVCAHYQVPTGRPTDMAELLEKLETDKALALDFWMVVTQMIGGGDEMSGVAGNERARHARMVQERALDAIARVMTGFGATELRAIDVDARQAVMLMASELAGKDPRFGVWADGPPPVSEAAAGGEAQAVAAETAVAPAPAVAVQAAVVAEAAIAAETMVAAAPVVAAEAAAEPARETIENAAEIYREALRARFEQEWYESQMEEVAAASAAREREVADRVAAAKSEEAPAAEVVVEAAGRRTVRGASPRGPETRVWFADEATRTAGDDFRQKLFGEEPEVADPLGARPGRFRLPQWLRMWGRAWKPVAPPATRERSGAGTTWTLALVALLVGGVALVHAQRSGLLGHGMFQQTIFKQGQEMFARGEGMVRDAVASLTTPAEASASVAVEGSAGSEAGDGTTRASQPAKQRRAGGAGVTKAASVEAGDAAPVLLTTKESSTIAREVSSAVAQSVSTTISQRESGAVGVTAASKPAQAPAFADGAPVHIEGATVSSGPGGPIAVASPVMSVDLISSPAAQYTAAPGTRPVDGQVVLHALISKSGAVEELQVLDGDPLLRPAALRTVSGWRYRPYLVNGEPVEVATTITVNFKIDY